MSGTVGDLFPSTVGDALGQKESPTVGSLFSEKEQYDPKTGMPTNESIFQQYMTPKGITFDPNEGMHVSPKDKFLYHTKDPYQEPLVHETERNFWNAYVGGAKKILHSLNKNLPSSEDISQMPSKTKEFLTQKNNVEKNLVSVGDIIPSIGGMGAGIVGDVIVRGEALLQGKTWKESGEAGNIAAAQDMENLGRPFHKLYEEHTKDMAPSNLDNIMNVFVNVANWSTKQISRVTGLNDNDATSLKNIAMLLGPAKAASLAVRGTVAGGMAINAGLRAFGDVVGEGVTKGFKVEVPKEQTISDFLDDNIKTRQKTEPRSLMGQQQLDLLNEKSPVNVKESTLTPRAAEDLDISRQKGFTIGKQTPRRQGDLFPNTLPGKVEKTVQEEKPSLQADLFPKELERAKEESKPVAIQKQIEPDSLYGTFKSSFAKYYSREPSAQASQAFNAFDTFQAREKLRLYQDLNNINDLVKDPKEQEVLTQWLQGNDVQLGKEGMAAVRQLRGIFDRWGELGVKYGVLSDLRDMYAPGMWKETQSLYGRISGGSRKAHKIFQDYKEGKEAGYTPITENALALAHHYVKGMMLAIGRKQLKEVLEEKGMIVQGQHQGFVPVNLKGLEEYTVDPSIAEELHFAYASKNVYTGLAKLEGLSYALKRNALGYSLFHPFTLYTTMLIMHPDKFAVTGRFARMAVNSLLPQKFMDKLPEGVKNYFTIPELQLLRDQNVNPEVIEQLAQGHVQLTLGHEHPIVEESGNLYNFTREISQFFEQNFPMGVPVVNGFIRLNKAIDHFTWQGIHTGFKTMLFMHEFNELRKNNIEAHELNPSKYPLRTSQEIAHDAGLSVNVLLGGLNWRDLAASTKNQLLRTGLMKLIKPTSRRVWHQIQLAPDWNTSTIASWTLALGKNTGLRGLIKPQTLADLQRQYILKAALYYGILANGLNMHWNNGKPIWENEDPTTIVLPDGKKLQVGKHLFEIIKWGMQPRQEFINKQNISLKELEEQALQVEYIKVGGDSPKMKDSLKHLLKIFRPISVSNLTDANSSLYGLIAFPTSGLDYKQQEERKQKSKEKAKQTRMEKKYKKYEYTGN